MSNKENFRNEFEQYAESKLNEHVAELNTRYENEKIDKETLERAFEVHKTIFSSELDEKIQILENEKSDTFNKERLEDLKKQFLQKFKLLVNKV
ncbi:MAG: hypothetical protein ABIY35_07845 [Chitinophagaceae bacterium]